MHFAAFLLLIIGGLNWLLVGIFSWDISELWGGMDHWASKIIYVIIGLAAIYEIISHKKSCKKCMGLKKKEEVHTEPSPAPEQMNSEE